MNRARLEAAAQRRPSDTMDASFCVEALEKDLARYG
jgi:hypothetical protein